MDYFEHYKRVNDLSEGGRRSHWKPFEKILGPFLPQQKEAVIVDVGCGAGILLEWLQSKGYSHVSGIDPDQGQIAFCKQLEVQAEHVADSAGWLETKSGIDLLICKDILEHIPEEQVRAILAAAKQSLKPEGKLYISVPNALASLAPFWLYNDGTHLRSYTESVLGLELARAGFDVVAVGDDDNWAVGGIAGIFRLALRTVFRLVRRLEVVGEFGGDGLRVPLGLNLVMVAKRANEQTPGR
jgi:2-polyprenyl-3-methyl-5-hydroxy-6-metoxy-1,4-benzoquinol methylase